MSSFTPVESRLIVINYMLSEIIAEGVWGGVRNELIAGRQRQKFYCYWTRSKQKAFEDWVEYMEKEVDEACGRDLPPLAYQFNEENKRCSQIDIRIYEDGKWEDKTNYSDWTDEEIESYNNSKYGELMGAIEIEVHCIDCDYTIEKNRFDRGGGRIMFNDVVGEYRCGVCDDRCSDPDGMFPDSETDDEEEILLTCFKCEKKYMGVEGNCCCGKCCSYCR